MIFAAAEAPAQIKQWVDCCFNWALRVANSDSPLTYEDAAVRATFCISLYGILVDLRALCTKGAANAQNVHVKKSYSDMLSSIEEVHVMFSREELLFALGHVVATTGV